MKLVVSTIVVCLSLVLPAWSDETTKASATFLELRKSIIALDCSEYADSPETFAERDRLRAVGFKVASDLIEKYQSGALSKEDRGLVNFTLRIDGLFGDVAGHDNKEFILGRLFEASVIHVRQAIKASGTPDASKELYKKNNCDLID